MSPGFFCSAEFAADPIRLKCDRAQPCETCSNRGLSNSCSYQSPIFDGKIELSQLPRIPPASVQDRINQLEKSVVSLARMLNVTNQAGQAGIDSASDEVIAKVSHNQAGSRGLEANYQTQLSDTFGRISLENAETSYVGSTHWTAILDSVGIQIHRELGQSSHDINEADGK